MEPLYSIRKGVPSVRVVGLVNVDKGDNEYVPETYLTYLGL